MLVLRPRIILLDEPTAGLDFAGISAMLALLKRLHQAGTTLVISTHDTDLAYEWAMRPGSGGRTRRRAGTTAGFCAIRKRYSKRIRNFQRCSTLGRPFRRSILAWLD